MEDNIDTKKLLNIFFNFDEKPNYFDQIKEVIKNFKDKFIIKGEFNNSTVLKEINYYLGIKVDDREEIEERETQNVIISYISTNNAKELLRNFITQNKKSIVKNDDHPFFIFFPYENEPNFNIKDIFEDVHKLQSNYKEIKKLDSRNLFLENQDTILDRIEKIYNYFNEKDEIDFNDNSIYDKNNTINIFIVGKRGSGKSTLINRLLGEKKAYAQKNAKTEKTKEYYHKLYPLKFIDSAGFEIGKNTELKDVEEFLKKNNLDYDNIYKKIHFIFFLLSKHVKVEEKEIEIIKKLYSFNIEMFFIITFMEEDEEESSKNEFKESLKSFFNKGKTKEKKEIIEKIIKNTFCLDLLNVQYSYVICNILEAINKKISEYKESNNRIIEYLFNYNYLIKTKDNTYEFIEGNSSLLDENEKIKLKKDNLKEGIITPYESNPPNEVLELIKKEIEHNIFFIDFENDRANRKTLANNIVKSFKTPGFWLSTIPIPFLNEYLSRKSKEKMISEIVRIYEFVIPKRMEEIDFKENNKNILVKFVFKIGGFVAGMWNYERVDKLGKRIIDELDADYTKMNILNIYYDKASNLNKNFEILSDFPEKFKNSEFWYNANIK